MDMSGMDMGSDHSHHSDSMGMNMYFVTHYKDYPVMFRHLVAHGPGGAFGIFCVLFFGAFLLRGVSFLSLYLEQSVFKTQSANINIVIEEEDNCACDDADYSSNGKNSIEPQEETVNGIITTTTKRNTVIKKTTIKNAASQPKQRSVLAQLFAPTWGEVYKDIIRLVVYFVQAMLSFALMIAAMSYIILYFFAICLGIAFGEVFFNRLRIAMGLNNNLSGVCGNLH